MRKKLVRFLALLPVLGLGVVSTTALAAGGGSVVEIIQDAGPLKLFACAFLAIFGAINLFMPKKLWEMGMTRKAREMQREPTTAELNGNRITGVIFIFLAVMLFLGRIN